MQSVSKDLINLIKNLQKLSSLKSFSLGGGTNLALRYQHRRSDDIDLFTNQIIGKIGFDQIRKELELEFGKNLMNFNYPCDENDQFIFARCFINEGESLIKVELIQNMKIISEIEYFEGIQLVSKLDVGLFKLISASNRYSKKDIYDLEYICNDIQLIELYEKLKLKKALFNKPEDRTIFDLDDELCPIDDPSLLLKFDEKKSKNHRVPSHSNDQVIAFRGLNWNSARFSWRNKVRELYITIGYKYPSNTLFS
jgi:hypothetical protein